jgi:5'-nucleotidase
MRYVFDPRRPAGERVVTVEVGGAPLDEARRYVLATHDFLAAGGNGYTVFAGHEPVYNDSGRWLRDVLAAWWRRRGSVAPGVDGRIAAAGP